MRGRLRRTPDCNRLSRQGRTLVGMASANTRVSGTPVSVGSLRFAARHSLTPCLLPAMLSSKPRRMSSLTRVEEPAGEAARRSANRCRRPAPGRCGAATPGGAFADIPTRCRRVQETVRHGLQDHHEAVASSGCTVAPEREHPVHGMATLTRARGMRGLADRPCDRPHRRGLHPRRRT
jgi:hypothetical protein